ncbi:MAG: 50S ribosomal protein L25 [Acidimicrobiales bacterium]|jgi:large subunit ribosomal protein L25
MSEINLVAETGRTLGSRESRRLRREDKIPAVVYGHGNDPVAVAVDRPLLRAALNAAGPNAVITLDIDGSQNLTIVKDMQRDPIANRVTHVDFLLINADEKLTVDVPIHMFGEAAELEKQGGVAQQQLMNLAIEAAASDIPAQIDIDISELVIETPLRVSDMDIPAGVTVLDELDSLVVIGQRSRASLAEGEEEGETEGGEIEAAEGGEADSDS